MEMSIKSLERIHDELVDAMFESRRMRDSLESGDEKWAYRKAADALDEAIRWLDDAVEFLYEGGVER